MFFYVESLFINFPIKVTIDMTLKQIYVDKIIPPNLKKHSMKKLLLDICTRKYFTSAGVIYEQDDLA